MFRVLFCECFTVIAKQRIDSGFFLFQAELKKKQEKKKNKKKTSALVDSTSDSKVENLAVRPPPSRLLGGNMIYYMKYGQTEEPSIPVTLLS